MERFFHRVCRWKKNSVSLERKDPLCDSGTRQGRMKRLMALAGILKIKETTGDTGDVYSSKYFSYWISRVSVILLSTSHGKSEPRSKWNAITLVLIGSGGIVAGTICHWNVHKFRCLRNNLLNTFVLRWRVKYTEWIEPPFLSVLHESISFAN